MQYGHFDNDRREYVIDRVDLPASWTNYLGTEEMCAVVNHTAGGYLFHKSAEYHRITRFRANAVPMDRPGHYIYLRDDDTGEYWSVSWQPVGKPLDWAKYTCRHGLSYTKYECEYGGIRAVQTLFIPRGEAVEIWDLSLENISGRARSISVFSYAELSFHHIDMDNRNFQMSLYAAGGSYADGIIEQDLFYEENGFQYFAATFPPDSYDTVREAFIGPYRTETDPIGGHAFRQHGAGRQPVRVAAQAFYPRARRGPARSVFPGGGAAGRRRAHPQKICAAHRPGRGTGGPARLLGRKMCGAANRHAQ